MSHRWTVAASLLGAVLLAALLAWTTLTIGRQPPRSDVSMLERSRPASAVDVRSAGVVGHRRCAECHPENAELHAATGHARTFRETRVGTDFNFLDQVRIQDEDRDVAFQYHWTKDAGLSVLLNEQFPDREFPLPFALGSGTHAVTFLTLLPNQFGATVGLEHRVSLFRDGQLARTPGATAVAPQQDVEYFGELLEGSILDACVGCHCTTWQITDDDAALTNLRPNVQCERCHGPGAEHVAAMDLDQTETMINFAPGLRTALEEIRMCGECHRLPEMLSDTKLDRTNAKIARYQSVGLLQSACFKKSSEQLRCTTCHNPHQRADALSRAEYSAMCRDCHQQGHVGECPKASLGNCITCHMPRIEVHPRVAFHDHWIRIRDDEDPATIEGPVEH